MIAAFRVRRLRVYDRADDALKDMMMDPPSVVVTDWNMKPMSGFRFSRMIRNRSLEPLCFVPVIVVMANATMSMVDRAFSVGANAVLVKPVAPIVLQRRLEWTTRDDRGFELKGDSYVVAGIEKILEERVRRNDFTELLRRQRAVQDALSRQAQSAQDLVDKIVNGEVDVESCDLDVSGARQPAKPVYTWNS